jgi:hypothetical protein
MVFSTNTLSISSQIRLAWRFQNAADLARDHRQ